MREIERGEKREETHEWNERMGERKIILEK